MTQEKPNWKKIKAEFIAGSTLKELSEKYQIKFATVSGRHRRENWSEARSKKIAKTSEKTIEKISDAEAEEAFDEIKRLKELIKDAEADLPNVEAGSKEGLLRSINELYKTLGTHTGKTVQKTEHSGSVQVTPIFGDMKLNVHSNDSNEKDTKSNEAD